jgi:hypothetical protein
MNLKIIFLLIFEIGVIYILKIWRGFTVIITVILNIGLFGTYLVAESIKKNFIN